MRTIELKCIECDAKSKMYSMEHDGNGNAAAALTCTNDYCRASFVFSWRYARTGQKEGLKPIEYVNVKATKISGRGIGFACLPCPECGGKANIKKTNRIHKEIYTVYHKCMSCGLNYSSQMHYSHTITISAFKVNDGLRHLLSVMTPEQLKGLAKASGNATMLPKN
ncbi:TPA: ogr/Delta-like zinc finger family protein [Enterobacter cloacae]